MHALRAARRSWRDPRSIGHIVSIRGCRDQFEGDKTSDRNRGRPGTGKNDVCPTNGTAGTVATVGTHSERAAWTRPDATRTGWDYSTGSAGTPDLRTADGRDNGLRRRRWRRRR